MGFVRFAMSTQQEWLPTPAASLRLGISSFTLKRRRDISGGHLVNGQHWRFSTDSPNSTLLWEVESIAAEFNKRGMNARRAAQAAAPAVKGDPAEQFDSPDALIEAINEERAAQEAHA